MPSIEQIYPDTQLSKVDKRVLEYLQGVEKTPSDLLTDGVIRNRNLLYATLHKLTDRGYLIRRKDPSNQKQSIYTTNYFTPVPRSSGWQRYLLEPQMTKYRNAAKLGLHLYYYCVEHVEGHKNRCLSLAEDLGLQNFVDNIMKSSITVLPGDATELIRKVDTKIREHHDNIVGAAFSITYLILVSMRLKRNQKSETNPKRRILDELRILTDERWVNEYSKICLDAWFSRNILDETRVKNMADRNGELFFHILKRYVSTFGTQHTQSDLLHDFFEEKISIDNEKFQEKAEKVLIRRTGKITLVSGSGTFCNITTKRKKIKVSTKEQLKGGIRLNLTVNSPASNIIPLVEVRTWLPRAIKNQGWKEIDKNLEKRFQSYIYPDSEKKEIQIDCDAPTQKGTYYIIFALAEETDCEYVASMTNWRINYPVWNDECDIADMTKLQIEKLQKDGYIETSWLREDGYVPLHLAADAITIEVS